MPPVLLKTGDSLEISAVAGLKLEWLKAVDAASGIEVDASSLGRIDTAGLQLLLSLKREAIARNIGFSWSGVSAVLREKATALGIDQELI